MPFFLRHVAALAALLCFTRPAGAQIRYATGQNVVPVYEGWEKNPDGSYTMVFGYMNRNYEQEIDIPLGPDNKFEPGGDRGQPTHFYARRQSFVFRVKLPRDWGDKELVWTLNSAGQTEQAFGVLTPVWEIGSSVYQQNRGGPMPADGNQAPSIEIVGPTQRTVSAGQPLALSVEIADDGRTMPRARRPGASAARGGREGGMPARMEGPVTQAVVKLEPGSRLGVTWLWYRGGPGPVKFEPMRVTVVSSDVEATRGEALSGRANTQVLFARPGSYTLRAYADDGVVIATVDVNVTVLPDSDQ
jgi:hypothetical protein